MRARLTLCAQEALAKFMGTAECIIYAYDLSTVPSVLPAFANAKDLIVIDEASYFATNQLPSLYCEAIHWGDSVTVIF